MKGTGTPARFRTLLSASTLALAITAIYAQAPTQTQPVDKQLAEGLMQSDVLAALDAIQFGAAKPLDRDGMARVTKGMIAEYEASPEVFRGALRQTKEAIDETRKLEDDFEIALSRSILLSELYKVHLSEDLDSGSVINELFRQNPVLVFDVESEIPLTKEDTKAMTAYYAFLIDIILEGTDVKGMEILNDLEEAFIDMWGYMEMDQQLEVSSAPIRWQILNGRWAAIPDAEKPRYKAAIRNALIPTDMATHNVNDPAQREELLITLIGGGILAGFDPYEIIDRNNVTFWDYFKRPVVGWDF